MYYHDHDMEFCPRGHYSHLLSRIRSSPADEWHFVQRCTIMNTVQIIVCADTIGCLSSPRRTASNDSGQIAAFGQHQSTNECIPSNLIQRFPVNHRLTINDFDHHNGFVHQIARDISRWMVRMERRCTG